MNAFGDVIGEDGKVLAGPRADDGSFIGTTELLRTRLIEPPQLPERRAVENTTLVCLMTDAALTKRSAGSSPRWRTPAWRARSTRFTPRSTATWCSRSRPARRRAVDPLIVGVVGAALTAEAIRDGVPPGDDRWPGFRRWRSWALMRRENDDLVARRVAYGCSLATCAGQAARSPATRSLESVQPGGHARPGTRHADDRHEWDEEACSTPAHHLRRMDLAAAHELG